MYGRKLLYCILSLTFIASCHPSEERQGGGDEDPKPEELTLKERVESMMVKVDGGTFIMGQTTSGLDNGTLTRAESDAQDNNEPRPD